MSRVLTILLLCLSLNSIGLADEPDRTPIFDGTSLDGWRAYSADKTPEGWDVSDGAIHRASGGGDIMTTETYGDFDLKLEWKISEGGNSGIIYRSRAGDGAPYLSGPEYQVLDDSAHKEEDKRHLSGALYGLYACESNVAKPAGEWNTARIVIHNKHVEHWLNGKKVVDCKLHSDDWEKRVSDSKFSAWDQFGKSDVGHIVLQDHGNEVWYRNIEIARLGNDEADAH